MEINKLKDKEFIKIFEMNFNDGSFLRDKLKEWFENEKYDVKVEHPTRFNENHRKADLIVSFNNSSHEIIFVIEVKRLNKDFSGLICLGNLKYSDNLNVNLIGSNHFNPVNKTQLQNIKLLKEMPFVTEFYQFGKKDLNKNKLTDVTVDHTGKQIKTLMQIYENTISYIFEKSDKQRNIIKINNNSCNKLKNIIIIPMIITNTDINLVDINITDYDLNLGKINDNIDKTKIFNKVGAAVINFSLNCPELNKLDNKFQQIILLSTEDINDFFVMLKSQINKYCNKYNFIFENFTKEELIKITRGYDEVYLKKDNKIKYKKILDSFNNKLLEDISNKYKTNYFLDSYNIDDEELLKLLNNKLKKDKELFKLVLFLTEIDVSKKYSNLAKNIILQEKILCKIYYRLIIDIYDYLINFAHNVF